MFGIVALAVDHLQSGVVDYRTAPPHPAGFTPPGAGKFTSLRVFCKFSVALISYCSSRSAGSPGSAGLPGFVTFCGMPGATMRATDIPVCDRN